MITILVVDDLPENLRLMRKFLPAQGYRMLEALDAEAALAIAASAMPDILLVDLRLGAGTLTGYELTKRVRGLPGGTAAVILALSGGAALDDGELSRETGFDGFVLKPFKLDEFDDLLKGHLAKK
ncbi:MAG TPA: response regulator, partial [Elusimicrobiota bacterium]|nr:response regulator [Elusimicrobiota bacterium]